MLAEKIDSDVMIITPHTDQQKLITRKIYQHRASSEIYERLNLRVFTFDTCHHHVTTVLDTGSPVVLYLGSI